MPRKSIIIIRSVANVYPTTHRRNRLPTNRNYYNAFHAFFILSTSPDPNCRILRYDKYRYFLSLITIIVSFALSFDCSFSNIFILLSNKRETCYKNRVLSETRKEKCNARRRRIRILRSKLRLFQPYPFVRCNN